MKTVQLIYVILLVFCASETESKLWILKLFQKAANAIKRTKEGSAVASAVAVAAVGGGAVADTIVSMNAEGKTPIADAQLSIINNTMNATIPNMDENEDTSIHQQGTREDDSSTSNSRGSSKMKPLANTRLVEVEVPCESKTQRGTGNMANPVQGGFPNEAVGRHSHRWFEKFYGQRVCKTFVEVPIQTLNATIETDSDQNEMSQAVEVKTDNKVLNTDLVNDPVLDVSGTKAVNADVTKSYEDIYIRPIMKFNHNIQNSQNTAVKESANVYIRPIIKFHQDVTQPSQSYNDPIIPYNNVHIRPIMKFNPSVTQPSQPKIVTETSEFHTVSEQPHSAVILDPVQDFEKGETFVDDALNTSTENPNDATENKQTTKPQIGKHTTEFQDSSQQPQGTLGVAHIEQFDSGQLFINDSMNDSSVNSDDAGDIQQTVQPQTITQHVQSQTVTQTIKPQTVAQFVQPQTTTVNVQPQTDRVNVQPQTATFTVGSYTETINEHLQASTVTLHPQRASVTVQPKTDSVTVLSQADTQTINPETSTQTIQSQTSKQTISSEVKQADQDEPKYSYMRNKRINGHAIEQDEYSSKEDILFTSGVKVSKSSCPWLVIALAILFGIF